jgi:hypothetical protein
MVHLCKKVCVVLDCSALEVESAHMFTIYRLLYAYG